jgi:ABC-2 type transport system permease protein
MTSPAQKQPAFILSLRRIRAVWMRHAYVFMQSPVRLIEVTFWPLVSMVLWGFVSQHMSNLGVSPLAQAFGVLLGGVILWELVFRTQIGMSFAYLEEVWARNLGHMAISPLRPFEWWLGMMGFSLTRSIVGVSLAAALAIPFYGFDILSLGWPLAAFFFNLVLMGWWLGFFIMAVLMRAGPGAEGIAWMMTYTFAPFCAIYYPISTLPVWMQAISNAIPAAHVFESLRQLVATGEFSTNGFFTALGLNVIYLLLSMVAVLWSFDDARRRGTLLQPGE